MLQGPGSLLLIVLASHCCLGSARGLFFGQSDFPYKRSNCKPIPANLQLCHGIEYQNMRLPNLLGHETMKEVLEQAGAWIPLVMKQCHPDTKKFLCSLFAPVCLDRPIYPCRWLCEAVRDSCEPVMQFFGFYWPEMLKCDKFPEGDVCIAMTPPNATEASKPQGEARVPRATPRAWGTCLRPCPTASRRPRWCPAGQPRARTRCGSWSRCPGNPVSRKQSFSSGSQESAFLPWEGTESPSEL